MQGPSHEHRHDRTGANAESHKSYIKTHSRTGFNESPVVPKRGMSFQKILLALTVVFTVSLILLMALFVAYRSKVETLESEVMAVESHHAAVSSMLESIEALETELVPIEEPDVYAMYTDGTSEITGIRSEYAVLIDVANNSVVAEKNSMERMFPASMTKVMTLIVAYDRLEDLNETFTFDYTITDPAYKAGASVAGFAASETVPFIDILYGIALPSGADATTAVAVRVAGTEEAFAELMNEKAAQMGLENTHFVNASGLHHPDHYSTAHEIAKIFEYAMNIPLLSEILSTYQYTTTPTAQHPDGILLTSTMFSRMYGTEPEIATIIAGKTGFTYEALNCLVSCADTPSGERYILVTGKAAQIANEGQYGAVFDAFDIYKRYIPTESADEY